MRVDLPAPFSPTIACTVPGRTLMLTSEFAKTPGNRLVIPLSSTAACWSLAVPASSSVDMGRILCLESPTRRARGRPCGSTRARRVAVGLPGLLRRRHLGLAGLDLSGVLVQLGLDVVDLAAARGISDAVGLEVVDLVAGLELAVLDRLDEVVDRDVDLLDHRGD